MDKVTTNEFPKAVRDYMNKIQANNNFVSGFYIHFSKTVENSVPVKVSFEYKNKCWEEDWIVSMVDGEIKASPGIGQW